MFFKFRIVAGSLPYKPINFGIIISHGCREVAFCPVGYFNLSHPVYLCLVPFLRYSASHHGMTLKSGLRVAQKMVPFESLGTVSYLHFIVTMAVSCIVSEI